MRSLNLMLAMSTAIAAVGTAQSADTAVAAPVTPVEAAPIVLSNVEYVSGKDGFIEKLKGELVIMPGSISFNELERREPSCAQHHCHTPAPYL